MEKEIRNENLAQEEEIEQIPATQESQEMDAPNTKYDFPVVGVIVIGVLVVAIVVMIILLYKFGGPIERPDGWWSTK